VTVATAKPARSRRRGAPREPAEPRALPVVSRHAEHSSVFLTLNRETLHYRAPDIDGLIAYRPAGRRHIIQLCGPIAAPADRDALVRSFLNWAREQNQHVMAIQLTRSEAQQYARLGFVANQIGSSYSIDLDRFSLRGTKFFRLRNKISRATRLGVTVHELSPLDLQQPQSSGELAGIDAEWLRAKGRHVKELTFLIGERDGRGAPYRRIFVARHEGRAIAYVTYSPVFGSRAGWLYDLTRRHPSSPPGTVELIFSTVVEKLRSEACGWLHLGLTPFVGLADELELDYGASPVVRKLVRALSEHGQAIYPASAQLAFKMKWGPQAIEPEYVAFQQAASLQGVWHLMRLTRAI
jgi:lysylphosphatidylglycerol synthetase-like protein (DUF2156 family)